jgi:hypothetical protein
LDGSGASPTYGAAVDVPGINSISVDPNIVSAEIKGDGGKLIGFKSRIDRMNCSVGYAQLSLDVLEVLTGQTMTTGTDNEIPFDTDELPKFKLECQILDTADDVGDVHLILYVCRMTGGTFLGQSSDAFGNPTFDLTAFSPQHPTTAMGKAITHAVATNLSS